MLGLVVTAALIVAAIAWRRAHPQPFPPWLSPFFLDNPWRKAIFPAERAVTNLGVVPRMRVLEVGPGSGYLTGTAATRVGPRGRLVCLDIQSEMLEKVRARHSALGPQLVCASGSELPFRNGAFDLVYLVEVLGEIPHKERAMGEYARVLRSEGTLSICEGMPDPDYVRGPALLALAKSAGFEPRERFGTWLQYTQRFVRP